MTPKTIKLIADGGSTKVDWVAVDTSTGRIVQRMTTPGLNPAVDSDAVVGERLNHLATALPAEKWNVESIGYYGAGVMSDATRERVTRPLRELFPGAEVTADSDMLGAARALCGNRAGIVGILGTGSNSCLYDGESIAGRVPPLGFILGDEGSGAVIGRALVASVLKGYATQRVIEAFTQEFPGLDVAGAVEHVYRMPSPNVWLASFVPFIARNRERFPELSSMVADRFRLFIERCIMPLRDDRQLPVSFTGSVARVFASELRSVCFAAGFEPAAIVGAPLDAIDVN